MNYNPLSEVVIKFFDKERVKMSYDLMVFEASVAPESRKEFMAWYSEQTQWSESHDYQDPMISSPTLQNWFQEMTQHFPAMDSSFASDDVDNLKIADYCIGKDIIYCTFPWPVAEEAFTLMRKLSIKHQVGFFNVSAYNGEILFPNQAQAINDNGSNL